MALVTERGAASKQPAEWEPGGAGVGARVGPLTKSVGPQSELPSCGLLIQHTPYITC
jgi:hypothetical protein